MMGVVFIGIETLRRAGVGNLDAPIENPAADAFKDWFEKEETNAEITAEDIQLNFEEVAVSGTTSDV